MSEYEIPAWYGSGQNNFQDYDEMYSNNGELLFDEDQPFDNLYQSHH